MNVLLFVLLIGSAIELCGFPKGKGTHVISIETQIGIKGDQIFMDDAPRIMIDGTFAECIYCNKRAYIVTIDDFSPFALCKEHMSEKEFVKESLNGKKVEPMKADNLTTKQ